MKWRRHREMINSSFSSLTLPISRPHDNKLKDFGRPIKITQQTCKMDMAVIEST
jgi:hypothetical protein